MSPDKQNPENEESDTPAKDRPGEIHRDEERDDRGIVYHGDDWDKAEEENERGMVNADEVDDDEVTAEFDDEEEDVEGHRERDVPDDDVK